MLLAKRSFTRASASFSVARLPELDGIRGLAILLVLLWHYVGGPLQVEPGTFLYYSKKALGLTWSGVDLFFVLSGFLIGGILLDHKDASNYFKVFYTRRVCRIFPLYFLWLAFFIGLEHQSSSISPWLFDEPFAIWSYATFTQNIAMASSGVFGPHWLAITWSLAVEEQFYLLLPILIYLVPSRWLAALLLLFIVTAPILRTLLFYFYGKGGMAAYVLMPSRADALLLGVLCAYAVRHHQRYISMNVLLLYTFLALSLVGAAIFIKKGWTIASLPMSSAGYSLLAIMYSCLLLIAVTEQRGLVTVVVRNRILGRLGIIAFGVYIFHQGISGLAHGFLLHQAPTLKDGADVGVMVSALLVTLLLASLSWIFFERPIVSIGHAMRYRPIPDEHASRVSRSPALKTPI